MSRLHEELQLHIHQEICNEMNEAIIAIKIHHKDISDQSEDQQEKIKHARTRIPAPQWDSIISLLERAHLEMIACRQPYKRY